MPSGTDPADSGEGTNEDAIPPDIPPDVEDLLVELTTIVPAARGAFVNLYEACKKIPKGDELAQGNLIASRKIRELGDRLFAAIIALNVKSTARDVAGSYTTDLATIVQQLVEHGAAAGLWTNSTTP